MLVTVVRALASGCRRHLAGLLKEHSLVEGGDLQVATWIKDEGFDTTISSVMQVMHVPACTSLLYAAHPELRLLVHDALSISMIQAAACMGSNAQSRQLGVICTNLLLKPPCCIPIATRAGLAGTGMCPAVGTGER